MELSISLHEHLAHAAALHKCLCPRQVLGVRMARFACAWLGIDPALHALQRKRIFVYMENGHCVADGVISVTHASPTNQRMQLMPYGKMAATFVNLATGQAVRVREHPDCRETAVALLPEVSPSWTAQLQAYQSMPDELLLAWQPVEVLAPLPELRKKYSITCSRCGDRVHEHCDVQVEDAVLCKSCAFGAYYKAVEPAHTGVPELLPA